MQNSPFFQNLKPVEDPVEFRSPTSFLSPERLEFMAEHDYWWVTVGRGGEEGLIQKNIQTGEIRQLKKWVEIFFTEDPDE